MKLHVDQSGKVEKTSKDTILCLSNDEWFAVKIDRKVKRQLQEIFRRNGQIRNYLLFTFCAGLAILLRLAKPKTKVTIDREYFGKEPIINNILASMLADLTSEPVIEFDFIGTEPPAHLMAKEVARGKQLPTKVASEAELLKEIKKTEVGKRLKDA